LATGLCVSGSFVDFYVNPDTNIRQHKWQRICGIVIGACGLRKTMVVGIALWILSELNAGVQTDKQQ
jgi:hypothetical protein